MNRIMNGWIPISAAALSVVLAVGCKRNETGTSSTRTTSATDEGRTTTTANEQAYNATSTLSNEDKDFINKAAEGGLLEVALGREVAAKATTPDVKAFANRMVTDHTKANDELRQLAARKGVTLPAQLDSEHKSELDKYSNVTGPKIDKEYASDMVDEHQKDVNEFRDASKNVKDPDVRAWAAKTLGTLESHLAMAHDMKNKIH